MKVSKLELLVSDPDVSGKKEPAIAVGIAGTSVAGALVMVLTILFPKMSEDLKLSIVSIAAILLPIIVGWITRGKVWAPASVEQVVEEAVKTQPQSMLDNPNPIKPLSRDFFKEDDKRNY